MYLNFRSAIWFAWLQLITECILVEDKDVPFWTASVTNAIQCHWRIFMILEPSTNVRTYLAA